jgi:hypothetical protein
MPYTLGRLLRREGGRDTGIKVKNRQRHAYDRA